MASMASLGSIASLTSTEKDKKTVIEYDLMQYMINLCFELTFIPTICHHHKNEYKTLYAKILARTITYDELVYFRLTYHEIDNVSSDDVKKQLIDTQPVRNKYEYCYCNKNFIGTHKRTDIIVSSMDVKHVLKFLQKFGFTFMSKNNKIIGIRTDTEITVLTTEFNAINLIECY